MAKYHFYNFDGGKTRNFDLDNTSLVSEVRLPRKIYLGGCAHFQKRISSAKYMNKKMDLMFGDPRIMWECKLVSKDKKDVPEEFRKMGGVIYTFEYKGGKFWVQRAWVCIFEEEN